VYELILSKDAAKTLEKLPPKTRDRVFKDLEATKGNPFRGKRLQGELEGLFRLRVGNLRVIYEVDSEYSLIIIHAIGSRGGIYKK
jgi:mRNA interferase RelE/StbE